jgi:hypothetical protein
MLATVMDISMGHLIKKSNWKSWDNTRNEESIFTPPHRGASLV